MIINHRASLSHRGIQPIFRIVLGLELDHDLRWQNGLAAKGKGQNALPLTARVVFSRQWKESRNGSRPGQDGYVLPALRNISDGRGKDRRLCWETPELVAVFRSIGIELLCAAQTLEDQIAARRHQATVAHHWILEL